MKSYLWLGDEAIAQAAIDAGISGVFAYPGTPSTEITEYIQQSEEARKRGVRSRWACNEKTSMEEALGMSYAGKRALVCMKHVGLNVAADAFINSAITGANGGLVVVVADDPSMHSSQNEQDSRFYGSFAMTPMLEPSSQQEAYDMVTQAFAMSETYGVPVMVRITTRLAHSRADVQRTVESPVAQNELKLPDDPRRFVLLPAIARRNYGELVEKTRRFEEDANASQWNKFEDGPNKHLGIVACGIAVNYLREAYGHKPCPHPVLSLRHYPVPRAAVAKLMKSCSKVLVLEDGYPFVEEKLRGIEPGECAVKGRLDGSLPRTGELDPNNVAAALGIEFKPVTGVPGEVVPRPPSLCAGCSHSNTFEFLLESLKAYPQARVFSDIGCYTLGALPPYEAINTCVDMGASITMAMGAAEAGVHPAVAVIGDSTFAHSGMTGLLDVVEGKTPVTIIISDNLITGMTGGQATPACGQLERIVEGVGVAPEHIHVLVPLPSNHANNVAVLQKELEYKGPSVIISRRACIRSGKKK